MRTSVERSAEVIARLFNDETPADLEAKGCRLILRISGGEILATVDKELTWENVTAPANTIVFDDEDGNTLFRMALEFRAWPGDTISLAPGDSPLSDATPQILTPGPNIGRAFEHYMKALAHLDSFDPEYAAELRRRTATVLDQLLAVAEIGIDKRSARKP